MLVVVFISTLSTCLLSPSQSHLSINLSSLKLYELVFRSEDRKYTSQS